MPVDSSAFLKFKSTMTQAKLDFSLSAEALASFLASRLCHDLISPVGAINNAMELYEDGLADEDTLNLISMSANNASGRLQFARLAYGAAGSTGDSISQAEIKKLADNYLADKKIDLGWQTAVNYIEKEKAKLLLNMISLAAGCIPRGGDIAIISDENNGKLRTLLHIEGSILRFPAAFTQIFQGQTTEAEITAHNIHFYWLIMLADLNNMAIQVEQSDNYVEVLVA